MAAADLAVVAASGAVALALATTLWSARLQRRAEAREARLADELKAARAALAEAESAAAVFDGALIAIEGDRARLVWGDEALNAAGVALGLETIAPAEVMEALAALDEGGAERLRALIDRGEPCRFQAVTPGGALSLEGRASGGVAWLRIAPSAEALAGGRFAGVADRAPCPIWIADGDGGLVWANRAWLQAVEAESLESARSAGAAFDRGSDALVQEAFAVNETREAFRWISAAGQRRAYRLVAQPAGEGGVVVFALDVTDAEETREVLARHVAAHDETLNQLKDAVAIFGPERRLTFHNTAFRALWDLEQAWLEERPTHSELLDRLRQRRRLPETSDYGKWKARELDFYGSTQVAPDDLWSLPDGRTLRVVRQPHPLGGLLILLSDITDELRLRAQYNGLIQVQKATLDRLNDAVAVFGSDGRLRLHNGAFQALWRLSDSQMQDAGDFDGIAALCRETVGDHALWAELKARVADPDPTARIAVSGETVTSDGRTLAYLSRPLPDGATLIAFGDVTARRELERALTERSTALTEAERLKREFVGNVSYELRTPLTTIMGYAEMLETGEETALALGDRGLSYVRALRSAAGQLARSIDDVLDMAEIDAGEMALSPAPLDAGELVRACAARARSTDPGARLAVETPDAPLPIAADARRMAQAIDHLIDNALRASPEGAEVQIRAFSFDGQTIIEVEDHGRGVPFHQQAHVFDRYVGRERGGPGLGLALVKALVELHHGQITLDSAPGQGARFRIILPQTDETSLAAPEASRAVAS